MKILPYILVLMVLVPFSFALLQNGDQCTQNSQCASTICNLNICIPQNPADWSTTHGPDANTYATDFYSNAYWNLTGNSINGVGSNTLNFGTSSIPPKVLNMAGDNQQTLQQTYTNTVILARTSQLYAYTMQGSQWSYLDSVDLNMTIADFQIVKDVSRPSVFVVGQDATGKSLVYNIYLNNQSKLTFTLAPHNPWNLTGGATTNFRYYALSCAQLPNAPFSGYCGAIAGNTTNSMSTVTLFNLNEFIGTNVTNTVPRNVVVPNINLKTLDTGYQSSLATNARSGMTYDGGDQFSFYLTSTTLTKLVKLDINSSDIYVGYVPLNYYTTTTWGNLTGKTFVTQNVANTDWPNGFLFFADWKNTGRLLPCGLYTETATFAQAEQSVMVCSDENGNTNIASFGGGLGTNSIEYGSDAYIIGATAFRNNIGDTPIICQLTYVTKRSASNPNYHELACVKWNGASFTVGPLSLFSPTINWPTNQDFYTYGLDATPNIITFKPTQNDNMMLSVGNSLYNVNPSNLSITNGYINYTTLINKSRLIAANIGYGLNLEFIASSASTTKLISAGYGSIITPVSGYIPPMINQSLYTNGGFYGYYTTACQGSTMTIQAKECTGVVFSSTCNYVATSGYQERLVVQCPFSSNLTVGSFDLTNPQVSCSLPFLTGLTSARVYIQSELDTNNYQTYADIPVTLATTSCDQQSQLVGGPQFNGTQGNQSQSGGGSNLGQGIVNPEDVVNDVLGHTNFIWKLFIGIVLVIASMAITASAPAIRGSSHGVIIIGAVGLLMFFFCTFIGLIPAYVLVAIGVLLTLGIIAWRVFFPNTGA